MDNSLKAKKILDILDAAFPDAKTELEFKTPLELLVATILSAQATDALVNRVTPGLFKRFKSAGDYAYAPIEELEELAGSINFYRNKSRNIKAACKKICDEFNGRVPETIGDLVTLPGVGKKTANVILSSAFGKDALAVDTHVLRVANRLGLVSSGKPDEVEADLIAIIPQNRWSKASILFILHGRRTCKARTPLCESCQINAYCDYYKDMVKKTVATPSKKKART